MMALSTKTFCQNSVLNTIPQGAEVYDAEKNKLGVTPLDLNTIKPSVKTIKLIKENYEPVVGVSL